MNHPFHIVDVFAQAPYEGNQLAVVLSAGDLTTEAMQRIALEMNFSETSFVTGGDAHDGYTVRIFTPTYEMPFAGHPTLGTAWLLRQTYAPTQPSITLHLGVGAVPVRFESDLAWLTAPRSERFGRSIAPGPPRRWGSRSRRSTPIRYRGSCHRVRTSYSFPWQVAVRSAKHDDDFGDEIDIRIEQGESLGRPSVLHLRASQRAIEVGGGVVPIARGEFIG